MVAIRERSPRRRAGYARSESGEAGLVGARFVDSSLSGALTRFAAQTGQPVVFAGKDNKQIPLKNETKLAEWTHSRRN